MRDWGSQELGLLAKLVLAAAIALIVADMLWHGVTLENFRRTWSNLIERPSGPLWFRFILQPLMAAIAATHDGLEDARTGRSPYLRALMREPEQRFARLSEGLNTTARVILLGLVVDVIYQLAVFDVFYPVESLLVAVLLAFIPYLIVRGPVARMARGRASPNGVG